MGDLILRARRFWSLVELQHGVVARWQLLNLGFTSKAIKHRIATGRLHPIRPGVYAVGRPQLTQHGHWMAAVLSCGSGAVLSHHSAAAHWGVRPVTPGPIEISVPAHVSRAPRGLLVHRRVALGPANVTRHHAIPVTSPFCTLIDISGRLSRDEIEAAINEADARGLTDPEELRSALDGLSGRPGTRKLLPQG